MPTLPYFTATSQSIQSLDRSMDALRDAHERCMKDIIEDRRYVLDRLYHLAVACEREGSTAMDEYHLAIELLQREGCIP
jgi:uncharacterized membrane protein (GlpM family)